jgi:hypothetical protein
MSEQAAVEEVSAEVSAPAVVTDDEKIPKKAYEEVKNDMLKFKAELRKKEAEVEQAKSKAKELELAALRQKEDYKTMYEQEANARKEIEGKYSKTVSAVVDSTKWNAMSRELVSLGINPSTLGDVERLINFDDIEVETTSTGKVNVLNAKDVAERFKSSRPFYFQGNGKPNVNTNTPGVLTPGSVTMDQVKAAEAEYKKTRSPESLRKYNEVVIAMKKKGMQ